MNIFEKLKETFKNDVSYDIKLEIQSAYFDVILEARDNPLEHNIGYKDQKSPSSIIVRYSIANDETYLPLDELLDGHALSFADLHMIQKVMSVLCDFKKEIDELCDGLCGEDRNVL